MMLENRSLTTRRTKTKGTAVVRCITFFAGLLMLAGCGGCGREPFEPEPYDLDFDIPRTEAFAPTLSAYGLYQEPLASLQPADGVHLYELSSELFSDYAFKQRLIRVPEGSTAILEADGSLTYSEGTVMVKTFYYPSDMRDPSAERRIIETRLLVKTGGRWNVATYLWNAEQTEAYKLLTGTTTNISWIDEAGQSRSTNYAVPQEGECVTCHQTDELSTYIGPTPRNLNRMVERDGGEVNQLAHLADQGVVTVLDGSPTIPNYKDTAESLENRARAYLDINCAHCHQPDAWSDASRRPYDLRYATALADTGLVGEGNQVSRQLTEGEMPYLGTTLRHDEGVEIVLDYIDEAGLGGNAR